MQVQPLLVIFALLCPTPLSTIGKSLKGRVMCDFLQINFMDEEVCTDPPYPQSYFPPFLCPDTFPFALSPVLLVSLPTASSNCGIQALRETLTLKVTACQWGTPVGGQTGADSFLWGHGVPGCASISLESRLVSIYLDLVHLLHVTKAHSNKTK